MGSKDHESEDTMIAACLLAVAMGCPCDLQIPSPFITPSGPIGHGLPVAGAQGYEASGAVWHPRLGRLFVVHDGNGALKGSLTRMDLQGGDVQNWPIGGDFEGVTVSHPDSNCVYIAIEQPHDSVIEFDFATGRVTKTWNLTSPAHCTSGCTVDGAPFPDLPANDGIESITFVPDGGASGGVFYIGLQADGRVYKVRLDLSSTTGEYAYLGHAARLGPWSGDGGAQIQGLDYDRVGGVLWALVGQRRIRTMRTDGTLLVEWPLPEPAGRQEGIAYVAAAAKCVLTWDDGEGGFANRVRRYSLRGCLAHEADFDNDGRITLKDLAVCLNGLEGP